MAQLPVLAYRRFYLTDDSAAQFLPTWHYLGEQLWAGHYPLLDPALWAGGDLAAEALFGLYNPLLLATMLLVAKVPDLLVAAVLVKTAFLVILALGVYGLAREYDVPRWFAVVPAVTVPFAGATLYFDAASWASGLTAFAFVPHFWWTLRRSARRALNPLIPFVAGYLAITTGNPYGALGACLVVVCLTAEFGLARRWAPVGRTILGGAAVGLVVPLVYLPLLLTQHVTYRRHAGVANNAVMVPGMGDLLNASTPSFTAYVHAFEAPFLTVPATYVAWYAVPLLPWLRFDRLRDRLPGVAALPIYAMIAFALCLGPSEAWMFRWPLRVMPYLALPVAVLSALAISQGLARDRPARRAVVSAVLVLGGAYLAASTRPNLWHVHLASLALIAVLVTAAVRVHLWRPRWEPAPAAVLVAGCVLVLVFQVAAFPRNLNLTNYRFPTSVPATRATLAPRYPGTVLEVANNGTIQYHSADPEQQFSRLMFGNMLNAVGVHAVNAYYGMGFQAFTDALCMEYNGSVCPEALVKVWQPPAPGSPPLADLLRLDTVVVENDLHEVASVPSPGWRVTEVDDVVTVLHRIQALPHPNGRLSSQPAGTVILDDVATARTESVRLAGGPGGTLTFARLDWPGYTAQLNGSAVPVRQGPVGLLAVDVPPGASGLLTVRWSPPGLPVGVFAAALGATLTLAQSALQRAARRGRRPAVSSPQPAPAPESAPLAPPLSTWSGSGRVGRVVAH
jgi:hypothetical protein